VDFDCVFGNVSTFIPDEELAMGLDVYSSHDTYVCGAFSLYKNSIPVNYLFMKHPQWREFMKYPEPNGWVEQDFSRVLEQSGLTYKYDLSIQGNPWDRKPELKMQDDRLFQMINKEDFHKEENFDWREIGYFHFRHSKKWPL